MCVYKGGGGFQQVLKGGLSKEVFNRALGLNFVTRPPVTFGSNKY